MTTDVCLGEVIRSSTEISMNSTDSVCDIFETHQEKPDINLGENSEPSLLDISYAAPPIDAFVSSVSVSVQFNSIPTFFSSGIHSKLFVVHSRSLINNTGGELHSFSVIYR